MDNHQTEIEHPPRDPSTKPWQRFTLAEYVHWRNGVPLGHADSLRNMLVRSLGAGSFGGFWQYWNPIWGYGLGRFVYSPLRRFLPAALALLLTFVVSGGIHDMVTMVVRRSGAFLFTPWFFLLGLGVILGRGLGVNFSARPFWVRVGIQLTYILVGLAMTLIARHLFWASLY